MTLLTVLALLPLWTVHYLPLQDLPHHLMRVFVLLHAEDARYDFSSKYAVSFFPTPYILADYVLYLWGQFFSLQTSTKLLLSFYMVLLPWSLFYFLRSVDPEKTVLGVFSFLLLYNWQLNKGFLNQVLSLPIFFFTVGYWWRHRGRCGYQQLALLAVLVFLTYTAHLHTFVLLALMLGALWVLADRSWRAAGETALAFVPCGLLYLWVVLTRLPTAPELHVPPALVFRDPWFHFLEAFGPALRYFGSFSPAAETKLFAVAASVWIVLLVAGWRQALRSPFLWLAALSGVLYLVLPEHAFGIGYLAPRTLHFAPLLVLPALLLPRDVWMRTGVLLVAAALAGSQLFITHRDYRRIDRELQNFAAVFDQIPPGRKLAYWSVRGRSAVGEHAPFALFGAYYYLKKAGEFVELDEAFTGPLRSVRLREAPRTSVSRAELAAETLASRPVAPGGYIAVISVGEDEVVRQAAQRFGYAPVAQFAGVTFFRREREVDVPWEKYFQFGAGSDFDYLVIHEDITYSQPSPPPEAVPVITYGNVHLYRRVPAPEKSLPE
ncbi:MAG: hypothetical protein K6U02_04185 [Firmicutes bacterium]|nr:hypothetical protein [Bacillota bacterium]